MKINIPKLSDSYKFGHHYMYPKWTEHVYSYFESRIGAKWDETVFYGLQYYLKRYLEGTVVATKDIDEAEAFAKAHFGNDHTFNRAGWDYVVKEHGGRLPVRIKTVPEGTVVPANNVMMTVEDTDPNGQCWWLTNHLETILTHVWYPSTVATLSRQVKKVISGYLDITAESDAGLPFMLHDFGFRGTECIESAAWGGSAHLVNFMGTDTVIGIDLLMQYYGADVCGFSVNATEHSIMTALGKEGEADVIRRVLEQCPTGILSVVGDSYDIFDCTEKIVGETFREEILARDGVYVVRPDSGDPVSTVSRLLKILDSKFGHTINSKNYRVLNPKVRLIWGDGIDIHGIEAILESMWQEGWSAENIVFGMGGGLLQKVNRDTQRFAFKSSAQCRSGVWHDIYKDPIDKSKVSKRGRLALDLVDGVYITVPEGEAQNDQLVTVFENGIVYADWNIEGIRSRAALA
jgi:nicotinamide phosphoribosyltransferase